MIGFVISLAIAIALGLAIAVVVGSITGSRGLGVLVWMTSTTTLVFLAAAVAFAGPGPAPSGVSHAQFEADRVMTQQMSVVVGPAMDALMAGNGMLRRSVDPAYLDALEHHVADFNRMAGLSP